MVLEYLKKNYIKGEPIFLADICIPDMTEENLRYHLKKHTLPLSPLVLYWY